MKPFNRTLTSVFVLGIILDQITKLWAEARFTFTDGTPNGEIIEVIGSLFRFQLAYNTGAAFSMKPQALVPWLHPTLFFAIVSIIAIIALWKFFKSLPVKDWASRLGVVMILSGAIGNFTDRIRIGKVVDFIDWDFPDFQIGSWGLSRWPVFNLADSWVLIGVSLIFLSQWLVKSAEKPNAN